MNTIIETLREFLGSPDFYHVIPEGSQTVPEWDYGAMLEYFVGAMLVIIVVGSVFKIITHLFAR